MYLTKKSIIPFLKQSYDLLTGNEMNGYAFQSKEAEYLRIQFMKNPTAEYCLVWRNEKVGIVYIDINDHNKVKIKNLYRPFHVALACLIDFRYYSPFNTDHKNQKQKNENYFYNNLSLKLIS